MADATRSIPPTLAELLGKSPSLRRDGYVSWHLWRSVVGARIASRSRPRALDGKTLHVTVSSSAWAQELSFLAQTIVGKLAEHGVVVRALRFGVGNVEIPGQPPKTHKVRTHALPSELRDRLDRLDDPRLRELIAEAASYRKSD